MIAIQRELRPTDYSKLFVKFKKSCMLTALESAFLEELKKIKNDSVWFYAIQSVINDFSIERFRQLVCELMSQQQDDFLTSEKILGEKAAKILLKLRP